MKIAHLPAAPAGDLLLHAISLREFGLRKFAHSFLTRESTRFAADIRRLEETSPHLLDDIGLANKHHRP